MIDTHCHLNDSQLAGDTDNIISAANAASVTDLICNGHDLPSSKKAVEIAKKNSSVWAACGLGYEHNPPPQDSIRGELVTLAASPLVVAVGESGLDFWDGMKTETKNVQLELFKFQVQLACDTHLPLVVHCRSAFSEVLEILKDSSLVGVQMHCWTGDWDWAKKFLDLNCYLSLGGIITFKKSDYLRDIVRKIPSNRLLIETDSPYLSPEPLRKNRNVPANLIHIAKVISSLLGISVEELDHLTTANAYRLFPKLKLSKRE